MDNLYTFLGKWEFTEMSDFDDDYVHAEEKAYIEINEKKNGQFKFGYVFGYVGIRNIKEVNSESFLNFDWEGNDEMDEASGHGVIKLKSKTEIEGTINFLFGDSYHFKAIKK